MEEALILDRLIENRVLLPDVLVQLASVIALPQVPRRTRCIPYIFTAPVLQLLLGPHRLWTRISIGNVRALTVALFPILMTGWTSLEGVETVWQIILAPILGIPPQVVPIPQAALLYNVCLLAPTW